MLECVVNVSEGRHRAVLTGLAGAAGGALLDVHADPDHHRAVLTLAGGSEALPAAVQRLARAAVSELSLAGHEGAHPRIGVLDVVPWVDLDDPWAPWTVRSLDARDAFARWAGDELGVPVFVYGPERTLPEIRRSAFGALRPDHGPPAPHPTAGAVAVGARGVLVAYNLWLADADLAHARSVAAAVRRPGLRTLGLAVGARTQVSCNLTEPARLGPADAYDLVAARAAVAGAELVGLLPGAVLGAIPPARWEALEVAPDRTIEHRLAAGRPGGRAT